MACFKQWVNLTGCALAGAAGGVGIVASGIMEVGSVGALTPAASATLLGSTLALLSALAYAIGCGIDLADCYEANGRAEAAARVRERVTMLQHEHDRLTGLVERLQAVAA